LDERHHLSPRFRREVDDSFFGVAAKGFAVADFTVSELEIV
jgi:hypothetical protein